MVRSSAVLLFLVSLPAGCHRLLPFGGNADAAALEQRAWEARPPSEGGAADQRRTDLGPLPPPRQVWPLSGSTVNGNWPGLKFEAAPGLAVDGQLSLTPAFAPMLASFGDTIIDTTKLPENQPIFWRLRSTDGTKVGPFGPTWWFRIRKPTPATTTTRPDSGWGNVADFDGDGRAEIFVGAHGSQTLYVCTAAASPPACTQRPTPKDVEPLSWFGSSVSATDVNGDGRSDAIVSAPNWKNKTGRLYVFPSGSTGSYQMVPGSKEGLSFGQAAIGVGDVDGDGYGDVIVTAPTEPVGGGNLGRLYLFRGGPGGLSSVPPVTIDSTVAENFGFSAAAAGDVNGDRYADVIVGSYAAGAFFFTGGPDCLSTDRRTILNLVAAGQFGWSVAGAGDVNGDGYADVIVGAIDATVAKPHDGQAFVFHGSKSGLLTSTFTTLQGTPGAGTGGGGEGFGHTVSGAGDMDGDGYDDVLVGVSVDAFEKSIPRRVYLFRGSASGVQSSPLALGSTEASFGVVAGFGDIDGDGRAEGGALAVHEPNPPAGGNGRIYPIKWVTSSFMFTTKIVAPAGADPFGWGIGSTY